MKILCRKTDGLGDYDWTEISKEKKIHFQLKYFRLILKTIMTSFWDINSETYQTPCIREVTLVW